MAKLGFLQQKGLLNLLYINFLPKKHLFHEYYSL